jgi:hypothetical protein
MFVKMYFRNYTGYLKPQIPSSKTAFWRPPTTVLDSVMWQTITSTRSIFYKLCCRTQSWARYIFNIIPYLYLRLPHGLLSSDFTIKILVVVLFIALLVCPDVCLSRFTEGGCNIPTFTYQLLAIPHCGRTVVFSVLQSLNSNAVTRRRPPLAVITKTTLPFIHVYVCWIRYEITV